MNFLELLSDTHFSVGIRDSVLAEPIIESVHVLTLTVFFGFVVLLDLRLLDVMFVGRRVSVLHQQFNRCLYVSFAIMITSGMVLFVGDPVTFWGTLFFRLKMVLLLVALSNVVIFNSTIGRRVAEWDLAPRTPLAAKVAAIISLSSWTAIIAAGRAIAYATSVPAN